MLQATSFELATTACSTVAIFPSGLIALFRFALAGLLFPPPAVQPLLDLALIVDSEPQRSQHKSYILTKQKNRLLPVFLVLVEMFVTDIKKVSVRMDTHTVNKFTAFNLFYRG